MSTSNQSPSRECHNPACESLGRKWEFHHGKYCSNACEIRHRGHRALKSLKYDHQRCFTCMRQLKTVEDPKPDFEFAERGHGWTIDEDGEPTLEFYSQEVTRTAAVGFQDLTEHATKGEKNRGDRVITGTICGRCGATDHTDHDPTLASRAAIGRLAALLQADDDVGTLDVETLHRVYRRSHDVALAAGLALTQ